MKRSCTSIKIKLAHKKAYKGKQSEALIEDLIRTTSVV